MQAHTRTHTQSTSFLSSIVFKVTIILTTLTTLICTLSQAFLCHLPLCNLKHTWLLNFPIMMKSSWSKIFQNLLLSLISLDLWNASSMFCFCFGFQAPAVIVSINILPVARLFLVKRRKVMVSFYARNHTAVKQRRVGIELLKVERFYQNANNKVKEQQQMKKNLMTTMLVFLSLYYAMQVNKYFQEVMEWQLFIHHKPYPLIYATIMQSWHWTGSRYRLRQWTLNKRFWQCTNRGISSFI